MAVAMRWSDIQLEWASQAASRLVPLGARRQHTLAVVETARRFSVCLPIDELNVLMAAAFVHDVGYAPELAVTGFHPLDGARLAHAAGHERVASLVAHHSASDAEAETRGLATELCVFPREDSLVSRALDYCDLTIGPNGEPVSVRERLAELEARLGTEGPVVEAVQRELPRFLALEKEMDALLAAAPGRGLKRRLSR